MEGRPKEVQDQIDLTIESIDQFSDAILSHSELYTMSEIELVNNFRMAIIFYRARERGEEFKLAGLEELNETVRVQLAALNETVSTEPEKKPDEIK